MEIEQKAKTRLSTNETRFCKRKFCLKVFFHNLKTKRIAYFWQSFDSFISFKENISVINS